MSEPLELLELPAEVPPEVVDDDDVEPPEVVELEVAEFELLPEVFDEVVEVLDEEDTEELLPLLLALSQ